MVNKTTNEQKLRLNREIMVHDMLDGGAYINGIRFDDRKQADWVCDVLNRWDSQSTLKDGSDVLRHLIRDDEMTRRLQQAFELKGVIGHHQEVADSIIRTLVRISNITGDDDIVVINKMINVLNKYGMNKIKYGDEGVTAFDVLIKHYVTKSVRPVRQYLEELRSQMWVHGE